MRNLAAVSYERKNPAAFDSCSGGGSGLGAQLCGQRAPAVRPLNPDGYLGRADIAERGLQAETLRLMAAALWGRGAPGLRLPQGLTPGARRVLRQAAGEARHTGSGRIRPEHVLLALARQQEASGRQLMELSGICVDGVFTQTIDRVNRHREEKRKGKVETTKLLEQFSEDLLEKAWSMEPIIGRERSWRQSSAF